MNIKEGGDAMGVIEESEHYLEILQLILKGNSSRSIERHLLNTYGEKISNVTISKFRKDNLDIQDLIQQVEMQQHLISDGKIQLVDNQIQQDKLAEQMVIKEVNAGIDVLNFIRGGLMIADDINLFETFFNSSDISLKDKTQLAVQLSKLDLDWRKNNDPDININNQMINLRDFFTDE